MSEYINANELKERIEKELNTAYVFDKYDSGRRDTLNWILYGVIAKLSAADVAPVVHGRWENIKSAKNTIKCSNCGHIRELKHFGEIIKRPVFCEMCGAKMGEREDNENVCL